MPRRLLHLPSFKRDANIRQKKKQINIVADIGLLIVRDGDAINQKQWMRFCKTVIQRQQNSITDEIRITMIDR